MSLRRPDAASPNGGSPDEGSIVMALLAILTMTGIVTLGLATVVSSHLAARHDVAFESALAGAERGLDELVAQVKADPTAASFPALSGTTSHGVSYTATAAAATSGWTVDAIGTATSGGRTVQRHIQVAVTVGDVLDTPLFGDTAVTLGGSGSGGSAIDRYDSATSSAVCTTGDVRTSMSSSDTRMCTEATPALGAIATNGSLTMRSNDLPNVSEADIFNAPRAGFDDPDATGKCAGDADVCASVGSRVIMHNEKADFPLSTLCADGLGGGLTAYDGSSALATNAVYSFTDVTLNATAIANLGNLPGSQLVICFNGTLTLPSTLPLNASLDTSPLVLTDPSSLLGVTNVVPRPPSTLLLVSTNGSSPVVNFGGSGTPGETAVSAVIYAPNATCTSNGHVDVYGLLVCQSVVAPSGLDVHYDVQLANLAFDRPVTVSQWREL